MRAVFLKNTCVLEGQSHFSASLDTAKNGAGAADNLADAARVALGKWPNAIPGAPLTELQRTAEATWAEISSGR